MIKLTSKIELKKKKIKTQNGGYYLQKYMTKDLYPKYKELFKNLKNSDTSIVK